MAAVKDLVRIAAIGDLHHGRNATQGSLQPLFSQISFNVSISLMRERSPEQPFKLLEVESGAWRK